VRRRSRHQQLAPAANRYPCGDGKWVVLNTMGGSAWDKLCDALQKDEWRSDERFRDASSRYRHMNQLVDAIDAILAAKSRDEWGAIFDKAGLIWGPVLTLEEVAQDPQADAIGMFPEIEHDALGAYRTVRAPMRFRDADVRPRGAAPALGQHTQQILREAGLAPDEIARLVRAGAVNGE